MKKLALDLNTLRVESFATQDADARRGTVRGHDDTVETENCTFENTCLITTCISLKTCALRGDDDVAEDR